MGGGVRVTTSDCVDMDGARSADRPDDWAGTRVDTLGAGALATASAAPAGLAARSGVAVAALLTGTEGFSAAAALDTLAGAAASLRLGAGLALALLVLAVETLFAVADFNSVSNGKRRSRARIPFDSWSGNHGQVTQITRS